MKNTIDIIIDSRLLRLELAEMRKSKNLTQAELAKILGCSQTTYSRYETGVTCVPVDVLIKLADFYQVSIDYITGRTNERKPYKRTDSKNYSPKE